MSKNKKLRKNLLIALLIAAAIAVVVFGVFVLKIFEGTQTLSNTDFADIDLSSVKDGIYKGEFEAGPVYAETEVTVKVGMLADIKLIKHRNGMGEPAENIIGDMLEKQTTNVDSVSGATFSSLVIRKAVENALTVSQ